MSNDTIKQRLREIVAEAIEISDFRDNQHFVHDLGVSSMLAIELLVRIEKEYGFRFPEIELSMIGTFNDVVALTERSLDPALAKATG